MADGPENSTQSARPPLTHFLCIPIVNGSSRAQLQVFLDELRSELPALCNVVAREPVRADPHVLARAVRPIGTIHLTLGVMSLTTEQRVRETIEFLEKMNLDNIFDQNEVSDARPTDTSGARFTVSFNELDAMRSPTNTSVVYLKPAESCKEILAFCESVRQAFTDNGFILPEDRPLKLHATVINTIYAKSGAAGRGRGGARRQKGGPLKLNVVPLLARYKHMSGINDVRLEKLAICKMGAKKQMTDAGEIVGEEYEEVASVLLMHPRD